MDRNKMKKLHAALLVSVTAWGLTALTSQASAVVLKAVYTGTLSQTQDQTNLFGHGTGFGVLDGLTATFTFIYDTAKLGSNHIGGVTTNQVYGGTYYLNNLTSPMISAMMTVGGHSESTLGDYIGSNYHVLAPTYGNVQDQATERKDFYSYRQMITNALGPAGSVPLSLDTPFSPVGLFGSGSFAFTDYNNDSAQYNYYATGSIGLTGLTVSLVDQVSTVPLPAALPLFG